MFHNHNSASKTGDISWKHLKAKKFVSMGSLPCLSQFSNIGRMFISFGKRETALDIITWPSGFANPDSR